MEPHGEFKVRWEVEEIKYFNTIAIDGNVHKGEGYFSFDGVNMLIDFENGTGLSAMTKAIRDNKILKLIEFANPDGQMMYRGSFIVRSVRGSSVEIVKG